MKAWNAAGLNNTKQLQLGATMYSGDNGDYMIPNAPYDNTGVYPPNKTWCGGNGETRLSSLGDGNAVSTTPTGILYHFCLWHPMRETRLRSIGVQQDNIPSTDGIRLRSYSMNGQVGGVYTVANLPGGPASYDPGAITYIKNGDLAGCMSPANCSVFMHESTFSLLGAYSDGWLEIAYHDTSFRMPLAQRLMQRFMRVFFCRRPQRNA